MQNGGLAIQSGGSPHRHIRTLVGLVTLLTLGATGLCVAAPAVADASHPDLPRRSPQRQDLGASQLIVRLEESGGTVTLPAVRAAQAAGLRVRSARSLGRENAFAIRLTKRLRGATLQAAIDELANEPGVASVEADRRLYPSYVPNDPFYPDQWGMRPQSSTSWGSNASNAWDINTGTSSVVVAVVDTGFTDHPDLDGRLLPGYDFVSDVATANDGDGRDADAHDPGDWLTYAETSFGSDFYGCSVTNSSWHGTHVIGIVGANGDNAIGIAGMSWDNPILPVRALGKCGGETSDVIDAMRWAAGLTVSGVPNNPNPARVINVSLGGDAPACSFSMQSAINEIIAAGAVVVAAAGNSHVNAANNEPGNCNGVINVAATGRNGELASYSNFGAAVTLAAPGGNGYWGIRSTLNAGTKAPAGSSYANYEGTSMAAPHVAGAVGLLLSLVPTLTPAQVRTVLTSTARPLPSSGPYSTCVGVCGAGLLDVQAALVLAGGLQPPDAPTDLGATPGPGTVSLSWTAPTETGGTQLTDYRVQRSSDGGLSWITVTDGVSTQPSAAVTGLTNGRDYRFRVAAVNQVASSGWSSSVSSTPATVPSRPRYLRATRGPGRVRLTWTRPSTSGGATISDYVILESLDGITWNDIADAESTATSATVEGLVNGTKYYFRVAAKNSAGQGSWSLTSSATPLAVPGAPDTLGATPGNRNVVLSWAAPVNTGGTTLTRYVVQRSSDGGVTWRTLTRSTSLTPAHTARLLTNGRGYLFRVAARNSVGQGPWSANVAATPRTRPTALRNVIATAGDSQVALTWDAPSSSGGNPIAAYRVEYSLDGLAWTVLDAAIDPALRSYTAVGLANSTVYRFRIAAENAAGVGSYSSVRTATPTA